MNQAPDKTVPILAGGAFLGILSALPILNWANCLCCFWVIAGGALAVFLYTRNFPVNLPPPTYGDGALLGVLAGIVGAVIDTLVSIPVSMVTSSFMGGPWQKQMEEALSDPEIPEEMREVLMSLMAGGLGIGAIVLGLLFALVIFTIFGAIGGLIGIALFKPSGYPPSGYPPSGYPPSGYPAQGPPQGYVAPPSAAPPEPPQEPPPPEPTEEPKD